MDNNTRNLVRRMDVYVKLLQQDGERFEQSYLADVQYTIDLEQWRTTSLEWRADATGVAHGE